MQTPHRKADPGVELWTTAGCCDATDVLFFCEITSLTQRCTGR